MVAAAASLMGPLVVRLTGGGLMSFAVIGTVATWGAIIFGFAASALWFWATRVRVPAVENDRGPSRWVDVDERTGRKTDVHETASAQTYWNRWAAAATAASVLCQAVATALSQISN